MANANSILLNSFFTRSAFRNLIDNDDTTAFQEAVQRYVQNYQTKNHFQCISDIYDFLSKYYPNEYYYKNTLLIKLLFGIHSPRTTTALTELPIENSKADFVLINGQAVVYEIKTPLDNLDRLESQLHDYYKAFSKVIVFTSEEHAKSLEKKFKDSPVGIYTLTSRKTIHRCKQAEEYKEQLSKSTMFKILRKKEQEEIIKYYYGELPQVSQFKYYRACKSMFEELSTIDSYTAFIKSLKARVKLATKPDERVPKALSFITYFSNYDSKDYLKLINFLYN